jgi:hypothetical protein
MAYDDDPHHPIIERPWEYEIIGLSYHRDLESWADSYLDLILQRGVCRRRLRFLGPQDLRIDEGFPSSSGLCVLDVSKRQLDGIGVRVANFEASGGCPTFWAREVIDLDVSDPA